MTLEFDTAWSDLNLRLRELEQDSGLIPAMLELESFHLDSGFIRDSLQEVEWHTFHDPDDPRRFFRMQYNPRRAERFAGSGLKLCESVSRNNGCFLCRENIERQQQGAQIGYQLESGGRTYLALTNPFPLLPVHIVIATQEHIPQEWAFRDKAGLGVDLLIADLVSFADRMPNHVMFYNGVDAGASILGHLHFHCVKRPNEALLFPLEIAAKDAGGYVDGPAVLDNYPLEVLVWRGQAHDVIKRASDWALRWGERNRNRLDGLSANIIATRGHNDDEMVLYFVPRDRSNQKPEEFSGMIGGLEVLGEIVLISQEDKARKDAGEIDYSELEAILASVRTPVETL